MKVLTKLSQFILENKERKKHKNRQGAKILATLTLMKLEQKLKQQNGDQSMRL